MAFKPINFSAYITESLKGASKSLPLYPTAQEDLMSLLNADGDYTLAHIIGKDTYEVIRLRRVANYIYVDRALSGTDAAHHHKGSQVIAASPLAFALVIELTGSTVT